jgi:hypothetical protein
MGAKLNLYVHKFQMTTIQLTKMDLNLVRLFNFCLLLYFSFKLFFFNPLIMALNCVLFIWFFFICDLELDDKEDNEPLYEMIDGNAWMRVVAKAINPPTQGLQHMCITSYFKFITLPTINVPYTHKLWNGVHPYGGWGSGPRLTLVLHGTIFRFLFLRK